MELYLWVRIIPQYIQRIHLLTSRTLCSTNLIPNFSHVAKLVAISQSVSWLEIKLSIYKSEKREYLHVTVRLAAYWSGDIFYSLNGCQSSFPTSVGGLFMMVRRSRAIASKAYVPIDAPSGHCQ